MGHVDTWMLRGKHQCSFTLHCKGYKSLYLTFINHIQHGFNWKESSLGVDVVYSFCILWKKGFSLGPCGWWSQSTGLCLQLILTENGNEGHWRKWMCTHVWSQGRCSYWSLDVHYTLGMRTAHLPIQHILISSVHPEPYLNRPPALVHLSLLPIFSGTVMARTTCHRQTMLAGLPNHIAPGGQTDVSWRYVTINGAANSGWVVRQIRRYYQLPALVAAAQNYCASSGER